MSGANWVVVAYVVGLGLLWGYGLVVWAGLRKAGKS